MCRAREAASSSCKFMQPFRKERTRAKRKIAPELEHPCNLSNEQLDMAHFVLHSCPPNTKLCDMQVTTRGQLTSLLISEAKRLEQKFPVFAWSSHLKVAR